jgi:flagellar assembly protein FliH
MVEIIRAPKFSRRRRELPLVNGDANKVKVSDSPAPTPASEEKSGKPDASAANRVAKKNGSGTKRGKAQQEALDMAKDRATAAEQRVAQLEQEIEHHFSKAEERGFEQGHEKGSEAARIETEKDISARLESLDDPCGQLRTEFRDYLNDSLQDTVIEVVLAAVGKLVGDTECDRDRVVAIVEQMARNVEGSHGIRVRISPGDFDLLDGHEWVPPNCNGGPPLEFAPDERIKLGGCIIETSHGDLDARLETQLRRLKEVLIETRSKQVATGSK